MSGLIDATVLQVMKSQRDLDIGTLPRVYVGIGDVEAEKENRKATATAIVSALADDDVAKILYDAGLLGQVLDIGSGPLYSPQHPAQLVSEDGALNGFLNRINDTGKWCVPGSRAMVSPGLAAPTPLKVMMEGTAA